MAHEVASMAYVGTTPWHGLGNKLSEKNPIEVWQKQAGMDFEIQEAPVQFIAGESQRTCPDNKVLYRSDNHEPLSVVGSKFKVVQPRDILEFYRDLTEKSGFELETAGVLKGGRKLWALAKTGQSTTLMRKDTTHGYVLLATACDGTLATTAQATSIRVVCNNTLAIAVNDDAGAVKVPHSTVFDAQAVKKQLGISVSAWDDFMYRMKKLSERQLTQPEVDDYFRTVFTEQRKQGASYVNERGIEQSLKLFQGQGRGSDLPTYTGKAYGLLNAVTEFVDHERRARSNDTRLDSAWFGSGAKIKQKALAESLALIS